MGDDKRGREWLIRYEIETGFVEVSGQSSEEENEMMKFYVSLHRFLLLMMTQYIGSFLLILNIVLAGHCYAVRPPGTVKVRLDEQVLYVDKDDISHLSWLEYVAWRKQWDTTNFVMSHVDSAIYRQWYKKELRYKPVVGITREQAEAYCLWRTKVVNEHPKFVKSKKTVCYTLLTEEQCQLLAQKRKWRKQNLESNPFPAKGFRCIAIIKTRH